MTKELNKRMTHKPYFKASIKPDGILEFMVYSDIGDTGDGQGLMATDVKNQIDSAGAFSRIQMRINSPGGDAFQALAIYNLIRAQKKPVDVFVDGVAASSAAIVAMAGDTITMGNNTLMMVHPAWSFAVGNAAELRTLADTLDKVSGSIAQTFADRTGQSMAKITKLMNAETWMNAQECIDGGFATALAEEPEEKAMTAMAMIRGSRMMLNYKNTPVQLKNDVIDPVCTCNCPACAAMNCVDCSMNDCADGVCKASDCPMQQVVAKEPSNLSQYEARVRLLKLVAA